MNWSRKYQRTRGGENIYLQLIIDEYNLGEVCGSTDETTQAILYAGKTDSYLYLFQLDNNKCFFF